MLLPNQRAIPHPPVFIALPRSKRKDQVLPADYEQKYFLPQFGLSVNQKSRNIWVMTWSSILSWPHQDWATWEKYRGGKIRQFAPEKGSAQIRSGWTGSLDIHFPAVNDLLHCWTSYNAFAVLTTMKMQYKMRTHFDLNIDGGCCNCGQTTADWHLKLFGVDKRSKH